MSENPVFDTVQALYPDVHIPDLLVELQSWGGVTLRHVVTTPPVRDLDEMMAEAKRILDSATHVPSHTVYGDFPRHTTAPVQRPTILQVDELEQRRQKLRGPRNGKA